MADSGAVEPGALPGDPAACCRSSCPAAMSLFDIGFDPMGKAPWRRARSPLRWLEAAAWGIPFVGDPRIYPAIEHGVTGFHARTPDQLAADAGDARRRPAAARAVGAARAPRGRGALLDARRRRQWRAALGGRPWREGRLARRRARDHRAARSSPRRSSGRRRRRASRSSTCAPDRLDALAGCDVACVHNSVTYPGRDDRRAGRQADAALLARPRAAGDAGGHAAAALGGRARDERLHLAAASRSLPAPGRRVSATWSRRRSPLQRFARERAQAPARRVLARLRPARRQGRCCRRASGREATTSRSTSGATSSCPRRRASRVKGPVPPDHVPTILRLYRALRLPADAHRAVRARGGRGVGGGLRADRQPQRRRAALARAAGGARDRGAATSGRWWRRREDPAAHQRALVGLRLRPAGGDVRAAAGAHARGRDQRVPRALRARRSTSAPLRVYPGSGAGWGNELVRPHAERHFGDRARRPRDHARRRLRARAAGVRGAQRRLLGAGRPRPGAAAACSRFFAATGAVPIAMTPLRRRAARATSTRSTSRTASPPTSSRRRTGSARGPPPGSRATRSSSASSPSTRARPRASRWPR